MYFMRITAALAASVLVSAACGVAPAAPSSKLNVVSTVSPITNIIFNIAGDKVNLVGIVPEGVNSHTFEPAPSDARKLSRGRYRVCERPQT